MFDIGFTELLIVAVLSLIILGPEKMPIALQQLALWIGRLKRYFRKFKQEIENEIGTDEIKRQLYNEEILEQLKQQKRADIEIKPENKKDNALQQKDPSL